MWQMHVLLCAAAVAIRTGIGAVAGSIPTPPTPAALLASLAVANAPNTGGHDTPSAAPNRSSAGAIPYIREADEQGMKHNRVVPAARTSASSSGDAEVVVIPLHARHAPTTTDHTGQGEFRSIIARHRRAMGGNVPEIPLSGHPVQTYV